MKYLFIFLFLIFFIGCSKNSIYNGKERPLPTKIEFDPIPLLEYRLIKLDTVTYKHNNIFYFKRNDSIYKVATKKETIKACEKLEVNELYKLKLRPTRHTFIVNSLDIHGTVIYKREAVYFERDTGIIWDIYLTPFIKDICYIKD